MIFLIISLQNFKIIIKINPTHLIEIEQKNWKKKQLKFNKIMQKLLQQQLKFNTIISKW
jgi:hypothetical protein